MILIYTIDSLLVLQSPRLALPRIGSAANVSSEYLYLGEIYDGRRLISKASFWIKSQTGCESHYRWRDVRTYVGMKRNALHAKVTQRVNIASEWILYFILHASLKALKWLATFTLPESLRRMCSHAVRACVCVCICEWDDVFLFARFPVLCLMGRLSLSAFQYFSVASRHLNRFSLDVKR